MCRDARARVLRIHVARGTRSACLCLSRMRSSFRYWRAGCRLERAPPVAQPGNGKESLATCRTCWRCIVSLALSEAALRPSSRNFPFPDLTRQVRLEFDRRGRREQGRLPAKLPPQPQQHPAKLIFFTAHVCHDNLRLFQLLHCIVEYTVCFSSHIYVCAGCAPASTMTSYFAAQATVRAGSVTQ